MALLKSSSLLPLSQFPSYRPREYTRYTKNKLQQRAQYYRTYNNFQDFNNDDPEEPQCPHIKEVTKEDTKKVFRNHNHIYFNTDVTVKTVRTLCDLIDELNHEYELLQTTLTTVMVVPKPIYLHITSFGGDLMAGFLAHDYIKNSKIPIYTVAEAYAVSSGANMVMAGKKRFMTENSYLLVHQLNMFKMGHETFHDMIDNTSNIIESMTRLYAMYLNNIRHNREDVPEEDTLTKEKLENHMLHDIFWNVETCIRYGLIDAVYNNYQSSDEHDIMKYVRDKLSESLCPTKTYSSFELKPSELVVNKIKDNLEKNKSSKNELLSLVKQHIREKSTLNLKDAIINTNISNENLDDPEPIPQTYEEILSKDHTKQKKSNKRKKTIKKSIEKTPRRSPRKTRKTN
jgi:ATP-dependent protease ClpP protease subunit